MDCLYLLPFLEGIKSAKRQEIDKIQHALISSLSGKFITAFYNYQLRIFT